MIEKLYRKADRDCLPKFGKSEDRFSVPPVCVILQFRAFSPWRSFVERTTTVMKRANRESSKVKAVKKKRSSNELDDHEEEKDEESSMGAKKRSSERNASGSLFSKKTRSFLR